MLGAREPQAPYIHMSEIVSGNGLFRRDLGWTDDKINKLILDAVYLLQGFAKNVFCACVCSIDVTARQNLVSQGCEIAQPHLICAQCCVGVAFDWYYEHFIDDLEIAHVFFDNNERCMHEFRQEWLRHRKPITTNLFWGHITEVRPLDMRNNAPLQAADMIAWATSRKLSQKQRSYLHLDTIVTAVIPNTRLVLDEHTLRTKNCPNLEGTT